MALPVACATLRTFAEEMKTELSAYACLAGAIIIAITATHGHAQPEPKAPKEPRKERLGKRPADTFSKIIDHSTSPNKRLAVAVGSKDGSAPVWYKHSHRGRAGVPEVSFSMDGDGPNSAANYLLDIRHNRVVALLDGNYFGTRNQYNHVSYATFWSPDSRWFLELQQWRWATGTCTVHRMNSEGLPAERIDFIATARELVDQELRELLPKSTAEERKGYAVTITVSGITSDGTLTARISAVTPKVIGPIVELSVIARIEEANNGRLSTAVVKVGRPTANKMEQDNR